jgi:hypothetical protein
MSTTASLHVGFDTHAMAYCIAAAADLQETRSQVLQLASFLILSLSSFAGAVLTKYTVFRLNFDGGLIACRPVNNIHCRHMLGLPHANVLLLDALPHSVVCMAASKQ